MSASKELDRLTSTFSADRSFCDHLLASACAPKAAELLVYYQWARGYLPLFQESLLTIIPQHFRAEHHEIVGLWTALLTGGILTDTCLVSYLALRGLVSEAGSVMRRSLENAGVLTHLWKEPGKATVLADPDGKGYVQAFLNEPDRKIQDDLKTREIMKRFASFALAQPASRLYKLLSEHNVHGGKLASFVLSQLAPTHFSCGFVNRPDLEDCAHLDLLVSGSEMLLFEVVNIQATYGQMYGVARTELHAAGKALADLLPTRERPSPEKSRRVAEVLGELRGSSGGSFSSMN